MFVEEDVMTSGAATQVDSAVEPAGEELGTPLAGPRPRSFIELDAWRERVEAAGAGKRRSKVKSSSQVEGTEPEPVGKSHPDTAAVTYLPQSELEAEQAELERLSKAALAGDREALDQLRTAMDRCPHVWQRLIDLQRLVELRMADEVAGKDPLRREAFLRRASDIRVALAGPHDTIATQMAISRLVACWLFAQLLEVQAMKMPAEARIGRNVTKQLHQAELKFVAAMRTYLMASASDPQAQ